MVKKSLFSPAQRWCAKTHLSQAAPSTPVKRETYLMKNLHPGLQRETNDTSRTMGEEDDLSQHPACRTPVILNMQAIEIPVCPPSLSEAC